MITITLLHILICSIWCAENIIIVEGIATSSPSTSPTSAALFTWNGVPFFDGLSTFYRFASLPRALSQSFALTAWVQTNASTTQEVITLGRNPSNYIGELVFKISSNGQLSFMDFGSYGFGFSALSTSVVTKGKRTHIAFVRNGLVGTFFVNGQAAGTASASTSVSYVNSDLVIGMDYRDKNAYFKGRMDNVRVYGLALSPMQVYELYKAGVVPSPLVSTVPPSLTPTISPLSLPPQPTVQPTGQLSPMPVSGPPSPTTSPSLYSTAYLTPKPSVRTTPQPTAQLSSNPVSGPSTMTPSLKPTVPRTMTPSVKPTTPPTMAPSVKPTISPTTKPSVQPTISPTIKPSVYPTTPPTKRPSMSPTARPTSAPTAKPSLRPSVQPTVKPTSQPSSSPVSVPFTARPTTLATSQPTTSTSSWTSINVPDSILGSAPKLLTDGTVLIFASSSSTAPGGGYFWRLTPDSFGRYEKGTWSKTASIPASYDPLYFASSVLPDGRVVIAGGEYGVVNGGTNAAIYDPVANSWTVINTPSYCPSIGDSQSLVLADGRWMVAFAWCVGGAVLTKDTLTWTKQQYRNKIDTNNEAGLTLLPDNTVLAVLSNAEIYNPSLDQWSSAGALPVTLVDELGEIGPQLLRPDGTVFVAGATGATAIYDTKTKQISAGPNFPKSPLGNVCTLSDAPGAVLPNGNVLVVCSGGAKTYGQYQDGPSFWYEFDGTNLRLQSSPSDPSGPSFVFNMLVLPTGQILQTRLSSQLDFYNPGHNAYPRSWRPVVTTLPSTICPGAKSLQLGGIQLNGMTQGAAYGDDAQSDTNYPLVRITNAQSKHVFYCRTHDHSSVAVQSQATTYTYFDVPAAVELGASVLEVVASGIASLPMQITVVSRC